MKEFFQFLLPVIFLYIFANLTLLWSYANTPKPQFLTKKQAKCMNETLKEHSRKMKLRAVLINVLPTIFLIYELCLYYLCNKQVQISLFWTEVYKELLFLSFGSIFFYFIMMRTGSGFHCLYEIRPTDGKPHMNKFAALLLWIINIILLILAFTAVLDNLAEFPLR